MLTSTQFLQHLGFLQKTEQTAFRSYLKIQTSVRHKFLIKLLDAVLVFQPDFDITDAHERTIIRKLIPGIRYEKARKKLNRWCNEILEHLEIFLIQNHLAGQIEKKQQLLREVYLHQGAFKLYKKSLDNQLANLTQANKHAEVDTLLYHEKIAQLNAPQLDNYQYPLPVLNEITGHLERHFAWARIRLELDELNRSSMFKEASLSGRKFVDTAWHILEHHLPDDSTPLNAYRLLRKALVAPLEEHTLFQKALVFIHQHIEQLSHEDANILLRQLLNIGNRKLKSGYLVFLKDVLELYQLGLKHHIFLQDGQLPVRLYINIATVSDAASAFEWTKKFIATYQPFLPESYQQLGFNLAMASHYFQRGSTERSITLLQSAQGFLPDEHKLPVWYSLRKYSLDLRIQYELYSFSDKDEESLEWALNRFSKYLQRKEILHDDLIELYSRGIATVRILWQYRRGLRFPSAINKNALYLPFLREQLELSLPWKSWIVTKAEELISLDQQ